MERKDHPQVERLGQILDKSLKRLELSGRIEEYGIWPVWNETVGPVVARNAQPEKIRNGTLFVSVTSPTWMNELQYMKQMIAEKLNERIGREVVKNIFFVMARDPAPKQAPAGHAHAKPSLGTNEATVDDAHLDAIRDPELRQALKRLFNSQARKTRK
jgi:predicted nucleic acid-binding Zn ribbon protein